MLGFKDDVVLVIGSDAGNEFQSGIHTERQLCENEEQQVLLLCLFKDVFVKRLLLH